MNGSQPPLSSSSSSKSHSRRRPCLSSLHRDLRRQSPLVCRSRHHHLSSSSSFCSSLAQAATSRAAPLSVSHLLYVGTFGSKASGLCLLQPMFVHEASTAVVASPRTQLSPSRSSIRMEIVAPSILLCSTLSHQDVLSSSSYVPSVGA
ncbi:hypothetical protein IC575_005798 [Cucumis melo]